MPLFSAFGRLVANSFQDIAKGNAVFVADVDGDALWEQYLGAFPEGTDPIFKKRTEHDCSCCKQFIRRAGAVVSISNGKVRTIWDEAAEEAPEHYAIVAAALRDAVKSADVRDIFRVAKNETQFGTEKSRSLDKDTQEVLTWEHFHTGEIPRALRSTTPDADRGSYRTTAQVFERGLEELKPDAVSTVLSLIESNSLYRGEEHQRAVVEFQKMQRTFLKKEGGMERSLFVWANAGSPAARFRNTVIGTLVQDLSEGHGLERAVSSFETKVAPQNYKRTTALITPAMIKKAMKTIEELDLEPALERRLAVIGDVSVNDVKWVDDAARPLMKGGIGDVLMAHAKAWNKPKSKKEQAEDISIEDFMARILPETQAMELFFSGKHAGNLMALTAPANPEPKQLFRWDNDFAWSYAGNVADSIKERVKKAGGKVDGVLRVSLSWFNHDDLDLHIYENTGRNGVKGLFKNHIYFGNKYGASGGTLDVDMNAGRATTREPVENVIWSIKPPDGSYQIVVNNFCHRESSNPGFVVEVESNGQVSHYSFNKTVRDRQDIEVATLHIKNGIIDKIEPGNSGVTSSNISQEKWGLTTEQYVKVNAVMLSPNHWGDNAVGNKHTFFVLEGAKSDEDLRGIYNEFLHPRLEEHRKVFEIIGDKTKCEPTEGHLAGLGFSSTKKDMFLIRATQGKKQRIFNVHVG